jgi:ABC-2 type transport system permease protein
MSLTQGESLLVTVGIPVLLLLGFTAVKVLPLPHGVTQRVQFLLPGTLALAVMATGMVAQGIATGVDRTYGVLKRLGATPLGKSGLLAAKITAIVVVEIVQVVIMLLVGLALGWSPTGNIFLFVIALLLATVAFSGVGMLLAGTLKSEVLIGLANGIYLVLLFLGGMIFPVTSLPSFLQSVAKALPALASSQIFFHSLGIGGSAPGYEWVVLAVWAIGAPALAIRYFKWQ